MLNTNSLYNKRVYTPDADKSIGRIRAFIFYEKKCVGFIVKLPDAFLMFKRKPKFLPLNQCKITNNKVYSNLDKLIKVKESILNKMLNLSWKDTVIWDGMPVFLEKKKIGDIGEILFNDDSGEIESIILTKGALSGAILGKSKINTEDIVGYSKKSKAIVLKDKAKIYEATNGVAEKAGKASSYLIHNIKIKTPKAVNTVQKQSDKIHDMFNDFKEEFKKGLNE